MGSDKLFNQISESMREKTNAELVELVVFGDPAVWSPQTFVAASEVLKERSVPNHERIQIVLDFKERKRAEQSSLAARRAFWESKAEAERASRANRRAEAIEFLKLRWLTSRISPAFQKSSVRQSLTIAIGVFLGLLAMRIVNGVYHYLWERDELPGWDTVAILFSAALIVFFGVRRYLAVRSQRAKASKFAA